jgi:hypothetical protein
MSKIYNYYFTSDLRVAGSTVNNANFNIDWSAMNPMKNYICRMTIMSRDNSSLASDEIICIDVNLAVQNNISRSVSTSTSYGSTNIIAVTPTFEKPTGKIIYLKYSDCPPFYITGRPQNPFLNIRFLNTSDVLLSTITGAWFASLSFEEVE